MIRVKLAATTPSAHLDEALETPVLPIHEFPPTGRIDHVQGSESLRSFDPPVTLYVASSGSQSPFLSAPRVVRYFRST